MTQGSFIQNLVLRGSGLAMQSVKPYTMPYFPPKAVRFGYDAGMAIAGMRRSRTVPLWGDNHEMGADYEASQLEPDRSYPVAEDDVVDNEDASREIEMETGSLAFTDSIPVDLEHQGLDAGGFQDAGVSSIDEDRISSTHSGETHALEAHEPETHKPEAKISIQVPSTSGAAREQNVKGESKAIGESKFIGDVWAAGTSRPIEEPRAIESGTIEAAGSADGMVVADNAGPADDTGGAKKHESISHFPSHSKLQDDQLVRDELDPESEGARTAAENKEPSPVASSLGRIPLGSYSHLSSYGMPPQLGQKPPGYYSAERRNDIEPNTEPDIEPNVEPINEPASDSSGVEFDKVIAGPDAAKAPGLSDQLPGDHRVLNSRFGRMDEEMLSVPGQASRVQGKPKIITDRPATEASVGFGHAKTVTSPLRSDHGPVKVERLLPHSDQRHPDRSFAAGGDDVGIMPTPARSTEGGFGEMPASSIKARAEPSSSLSKAHLVMNGRHERASEGETLSTSVIDRTRLAFGHAEKPAKEQRLLLDDIGGDQSMIRPAPGQSHALFKRPSSYPQEREIAAAKPEVHITIGTIEVREDPKPAQSEQPPSAEPSSYGFDEYSQIRRYISWER